MSTVTWNFASRKNKISLREQHVLAKLAVKCLKRIEARTAGYDSLQPTGRRVQFATLGMVLAVMAHGAELRSREKQ